MKEHFGGHFANLFTLEGCIPYQPVSSSEIDQHFCIGFIHRQCESISFHAALISQGECKSFAKSDTCIFNGMMFVDMKVARGRYRQVQFAMARNLFKHMIEETYTGINRGLAGTI